MCDKDLYRPIKTCAKINDKIKEIPVYNVEENVNNNLKEDEELPE